MSHTRTDDKPAFPRAPIADVDGRPYGHQGGLTARQYAAIHLCVPSSGDEWLDDMIREAQRDRFAMAALADQRVGVRAAWAMADGMMQERE